MLESIPNGTYKIRILPSGKTTNDLSKYRYQIQNTIITGTIDPNLNNQNWYEETVTVTDGDLFIGYFMQFPTTGSTGFGTLGKDAPIVAIEITVL